MSKKPASLTSDLLARKGEAEPSPIDPAARMSLFADSDVAATGSGGADEADERPRPPEPEIIYTADETSRGSGGRRLVAGIVLGAIGAGALLLIFSTGNDRGVAPVAPEIAAGAPAWTPAPETVAPATDEPAIQPEATGDAPQTAATPDVAPPEETAPPDAPTPSEEAATTAALRPGSESPAETSPVAPEPAKPVAAATSKPARAGGVYLVQISALKDEASARAAWRLLEKRFPSILAGHALDIERADLGAKGTWFRVRAAGYETKATAASACAKLKAGGQDCMVKKR